MFKRWLAIPAGIAWCVLCATSADAAPAASNPLGLSDVVYTTSLSVLTMLFVVALLLESAFSTLFNWRVFLAYFSSRGVKTVVMIVVSLAVVYFFDFDAFASLIAAFKLPAELPAGTSKDAALAKLMSEQTGPVSRLITSLILAGGSAGIYNLMVALGLRSARETEVKVRPPVGQAWVAIRVKRVNAVGPVNVFISEDKSASPGLQAVGSINFSRPSLRELLIRSTDRFPQNGGRVVTPDKPYIVKVAGRNAADQEITALGGTYTFGERAIVDFDVEL